ncbi:MAG TPA: GNAT family protein [Candidatus Acidoferrales bacterium]|nr:GNAT family protein [Candidatus Acidoferrales bacterium]
MRLADHAIVLDRSLVLTPRSSGDATEMFAIIDADRERLREWLSWVDATHSVADTRRYAQFAERQFQQRSLFDYAIRYEGALVGSIGLHNVDWGMCNAHIGYWLRPAARGHGIVTRAAAALTTRAFEQFGLHRLEIRCVTENAQSRAVPGRLGYHLEGVLSEAYMLHGRFRDIALYAMTVNEWEPPAAS